MYGNEENKIESQSRIQAGLQARIDSPKPVSLHEEVAMELQALHASIIKAEKPVDVFDELRAAQEVFNRCCFECNKVFLKRDIANKALADLSAKAQSIIEMALNDPTHASEPKAVAGNGRY